MGNPARMGQYISPNMEIAEIIHNEVKEILDITNNKK